MDEYHLFPDDGRLALRDERLVRHLREGVEGLIEDLAGRIQGSLGRLLCEGRVRVEFVTVGAEECRRRELRDGGGEAKSQYEHILVSSGQRTYSLKKRSWSSA